MAMCEWCFEDRDKLNKIKLGSQVFQICDKCLEALKNRKCIDCGDDIKSMSNFDKGRCSKCAQIANYKLQKKLEDEINAPLEYEDGHEPMDPILYEAWLTGKTIAEVRASKEKK